MEEIIPVVSGFVLQIVYLVYYRFITILSRQPHLEEEAIVVEQEETKEENKITHQPSQEEEIPREPQQGVQMYGRGFIILLNNTDKIVLYEGQ